MERGTVQLMENYNNSLISDLIKQIIHSFIYMLFI